MSEERRFGEPPHTPEVKKSIAMSLEESVHDTLKRSLDLMGVENYHISCYTGISEEKKALAAIYTLLHVAKSEGDEKNNIIDNLLDAITIHPSCPAPVDHGRFCASNCTPECDGTNKNDRRACWKLWATPKNKCELL